MIFPGYNPDTKRLGFSGIFLKSVLLHGCQFWGLLGESDLTWHQKQHIRLQGPLLCILLWQAFAPICVGSNSNKETVQKKSLWEFLFLISVDGFPASFSMGLQHSLFHKPCSHLEAPSLLLSVLDLLLVLTSYLCLTRD